MVLVLIHVEMYFFSVDLLKPCLHVRIEVGQLYNQIGQQNHIFLYLASFGVFWLTFKEKGQTRLVSTTPGRPTEGAELSLWDIYIHVYTHTVL